MEEQTNMSFLATVTCHSFNWSIYLRDFLDSGEAQIGGSQSTFYKTLIKHQGQKFTQFMILKHCLHTKWC